LALKSKMEQNYQCKFCETKFHKESTLATHMCVKKRRHMEIDTPGSRFGFRAFQRFYDFSMKTKKLKTTEDFINSQYYIEFVKFGHHLADLKPMYPDKFIDFVLIKGVKLKDWTKDDVYYIYIEELVKKEPAVSATERTITEIMNWSEKNGKPFNDFFNEVSANEAASMIKTGKISPWVLYLAGSGANLEAKFNEDHGKMIGDVIDPGFWMKKFKKADEDVEYIRSLLEQAGL